MSNVKTRSCPKCGFNLVFEDVNTPVFCECCEQTIAWDTDRTPAAVESTGGSTFSMAIPTAVGFDNPESGVVFIENFFDNYNWIPFMISPDLKIREIAEVVDNNKMKNGACAISWYLDYKALAYPIRKKIEGLAKHQQEMADIYNPVDPTASFTLFDSYQRVCRALVNGKKDIFKQLDNAIKYAEKFALAADKMAEIKNDYVSLKALWDKEVILVKEISEIPVYDAAKKAASKKIADELAAKGIDAVTTYDQAMSLYNDPSIHNQIASLALFEKVRGYEDSVRIIKKINQYFNYHSEMYRAFGSHFIYKQEEYKPATLDIKELGKKAKNIKKKATATEADAPAAVKAWSLFEVVDGKPAKESSIQGIDKIITCYGGRLYYFKQDGGIYSYDITTHAEAALCKGKSEEFKNAKDEYEYRIATNGSSFFVKKLITKEEVAEKTGCAKTIANVTSKFKKNVVAEEDTLNLYTVVVVDMKSNSCKPLIDKLTAIAEAHENKIFYTVREKQKPVKMGCVEKLKGKKAKDPEIITRLMVCDAETGACKQALDSSCSINAVYQDYIVYTLWKPNELNKDLHALNLSTGEDTLIERNIYEYFQTNVKNELIDGKVYYTVGNNDYQPLVRNNLAGTERLEIMTRVAEVAGERGGYLYIKRGRGANSALWKISTDGKEKYPLCSQFKSVAKFEDHYIYYVDVYNSLHVMRIDGKNNRVLAENVSNVITSTEGLYYTRLENVNGRKKGFSLYLMDKGGHNVKKVEFNLTSYKEDLNSGIITYARKETVDFKVYLPKKEDEAVIQSHEITRYYEMDKQTGETELVLTMGWPEDEEKTGCLTKIFKPKKHIYEEYFIPQEYEYKGLHPDYEDGEEDLPDAPEEDEAIPGASTSTFGSVKMPAGCANFFKQIKSKINPNNGGKQSAVKTKLRSAKASSTSKSKSTAAGGFDAPTMALLLIGLVLMFWSVKVFTGAIRFPDDYPAPAFTIILPFLMMIVTGGLAAICLGVIPVGKIKQAKPAAILYILMAIIFATSGVIYLTKLPGRRQSAMEGGGYSGNARYVYVNEEVNEYISQDDSVWFEFYANESQSYNINVESHEYLRVYVYTSNPKYNSYDSIYDGSPVDFKYYLYSGNTYWFKVESYYGYSADIYFSINTNDKPGTSYSTAYEIYGYYSDEISDNNVWLKYTATNSGYYTIEIDASDYIYMYGYDYNPATSSYDKSYSGNSISFDWYLEAGTTYWFQLESNYSTNFTFNTYYQGK